MRAPGQFATTQIGPPPRALSASADVASGSASPSAWFQLWAAGTYPEARVISHISAVNGSYGGAGQHVVQIGVGAAGSESVIFEVSHLVGGYRDVAPPVPILIPGGVRLAVRVLDAYPLSNWGGAVSVRHWGRAAFPNGLASVLTTLRSGTIGANYVNLNLDNWVQVLFNGSTSVALVGITGSTNGVGWVEFGIDGTLVPGSRVSLPTDVTVPISPPIIVPGARYLQVRTDPSSGGALDNVFLSSVPAPFQIIR